MENSSPTTVDVVAFGAHPDDVELGCGGTLAALVSQGASIGIVDLTEGEKGTRGTVSERRKESAAAADILKATFRVNLKILDTAIENTPVNRRKIIEIIRQTTPKIVLAPHSGDRHPDHAHASTLVKESCFYAGVQKVDSDIALSAHRPAGLMYYMISTPFDPAFYVDISNTFETKIASLKAHKSQFYNPGYAAEETFISSKAYFESIEARAKYYGWLAGSKYAEPLWIESPLLIANPLTDIKLP